MVSNAGSAASAMDGAQQQRSVGDLQQSIKQKDGTISEQAAEIALLRQQLAALQSSGGLVGSNTASGTGEFDKEMKIKLDCCRRGEMLVVVEIIRINF